MERNAVPNLLPRHATSLSAVNSSRPSAVVKFAIERPRRLHPVSCEAASSSGRSFEDFAKNAKSGAKQAGFSAFRNVKSVLEVVDDNLKRTASQVNAKFDFTGKAQQAAHQVSEQAKVVDSKVGIKRRLRNLAYDVERKWPVWQKRYAEFSKTTVGQIALISFIGFLFYTGLAFKILNLLFILWWLAPFILVPFSRYFNRKAEEELRKQAEAQQRARNARNPFFSPFFSARSRNPGGQAGPRKYGDTSSGGPVIDVEYETIDDK